MYKPYSVKYVERLERIVKCTIFSIGLAIPVGLYLMIPKVPLDTLGVIENKKPSVKSRVDALQEERKDAQVRLFIHAMNPSLSYTSVVRIAELEKKYSKMYNVPLEIGLAITWKESTFRPLAVSPTGPLGLKQVAHKWWKDDCNVPVKNQLFDIDKNIECGYIAISKYKQGYGTWQKALAAYHGHPTDIQMNVNYSLTVLEKARKIQALIS